MLTLTQTINLTHIEIGLTDGIFYISFFCSLLILAFLSYSAYYKAAQKGRNPWAWATLVLFFGLIGYVVLFFLRSKIQPVIVETENLPMIPEELVQTLNTENWYFLDPKNQPVGPLNFENLKTAFEDGTLKKTSFVWNEDYTDWKKIEEDERVLKELEKSKLS